MQKTRIRAILFDKDGTLIEFERTWFPIVSRVLDGMRRDFGLAIIGDSYGDLVFARRSGSRFIGMRTECNESRRFIQEGYPVVQDFSDLAALEARLA